MNLRIESSDEQFTLLDDIEFNDLFSKLIPKGKWTKAGVWLIPLKITILCCGTVNNLKF